MQPDLAKAEDLSEASVFDVRIGRHRDESDVTRAKAVDRLAPMLVAPIGAADKNDLRLAPVIGMGRPGIIGKNGSIERGAQKSAR